MLNIPDLEKRWLRYKVKSLLPYFILASLTIVFVVAYSLITVNTKTHKEHKLTTTLQKSHVNKEQKKAPLKKEQITKKVSSSQQNVTAFNNSTKKTEKAPSEKLSPSMDFINDFETYTPKIEHIVKKEQTVKKVKKITHKIKTVQVEEEPAPVVRSTITIERQDTSKDIQNILKRFERDKNPALSLFLAKKYYEIGNYQKASRYALITNGLNKDIEDSWLIFSKSLVKMHQKEKAIKILRQYINSSHSSSAAVLLHDILSGDFQ
jgi:tetratricopeptide (TPR) repeat protein